MVERYLEKTRYYINLEDNLVAELDIFKGSLEGLFFVEVEFSSAEEMLNFKKPDWFGEDITQEDFSANSFLAGKTFKEVKDFFSKN